MSDSVRVKAPEQHVSVPKPLEFRHKGSPPEECAGTFGRLGATRSIIELGEQVVGSSHVFSVFEPVVLDGCGGAAVISMELGAIRQSTAVVSHALELAETRRAPRHTAFSPEQAIPVISAEHGKPTPSLRVRFHPTSPGAYESEARITVQWGDGLTDVRWIRLRATARNIDTAPLGEKQQPAAMENVPQAPLAGVAPSDLAELDNLADEAAGRAQHLAEKQRDGQRNAEREINAYKKRAPAVPLWAQLAEVAVSMGIAGVAGVLGKRLGEVIGARVFNGVAPEEARKLPAVTGFTDSIKDGFKNVARSPLLKAAIPGKGKFATDDKREQPATRYSSNDAFNFFTAQGAMLGEAAHLNRTVVLLGKRKLQHVLDHSPGAALETMRSLSTVLEATHVDAINAQSLATEGAWMRAVAQSDHGAEVAKDTAGAETLTTKLDRLSADSPAGVLTINVVVQSATRDMQAAPLMLRGASVLGVSKEIADRLKGARVDAMKIPVVLVVAGPLYFARVTRDESGRVRVFGELGMPERDGPMDETQMHRSASILCDRVLEKSLEDWGIAKVGNDDASDEI